MNKKEFEEKTIEEMSKHIQCAVDGCSTYWSMLIARCLFNLGYRRESVERKEYRQKYQKDLYNLLKEHHMCVHCQRKDERTMEGYTSCEECAKKERERAKEYRKSDGVKEKRRAYLSEWRKQNPEKIRAYKRKSYAKKRMAKGADNEQRD